MEFMTCCTLHWLMSRVFELGYKFINFSSSANHYHFCQLLSNPYIAWIPVVFMCHWCLSRIDTLLVFLLQLLHEKNTVHFMDRASSFWSSTVTLWSNGAKSYQRPMIVIATLPLYMHIICPSVFLRITEDEVIHCTWCFTLYTYFACQQNTDSCFQIYEAGLEWCEKFIGWYHICHWWLLNQWNPSSAPPI